MSNNDFEHPVRWRYVKNGRVAHALPNNGGAPWIALCGKDRKGMDQGWLGAGTLHPGSVEQQREQLYVGLLPRCPRCAREVQRILNAL